MKKSMILALWAVLFVLCAGLGFLPEPEGAVRLWRQLLSAVFFVPPGLLLLRAKRQGDIPAAELVRNLSALSLLLTLALLVLNVASVGFGETAGTALHYVLVIVSSPMVCSGFWAGSLFLWACLLTASRKLCRKKK